MGEQKDATCVNGSMHLIKVGNCSSKAHHVVHREQRERKISSM